MSNENRAAGLTEDDQERVDAWWRAANYLSVGQIYLLDNPLLRRPLRPADIKPRLLGHWGTSPGLSFIYSHLNRIIRRRDLDMLYVTGPGHGGPALVAAAWLEGTYAEVYPEVGWGEAGMRRLFRQFSFPGGIPSHVAPETPGSIHEGGELGYSLAHAYGAAFDNPDLVVACVIGDGEAETGALAASWHANKFADPLKDGIVLPIVHLNGYKIASPTILGDLPDDELRRLLEGYGHRPWFVEGSERPAMHQAMAACLDEVFDALQGIKAAAAAGDRSRPRWPCIVLRSPKGWTGPQFLNGLPIEGSFRSHQVPLPDPRADKNQLEALEAWMRSYAPETLFDVEGRPSALITSHAPRPAKRMSASPHSNGGRLRRALRLPDLRDHAVSVSAPARSTASAMAVAGGYLREVIASNPTTFRLFGPDETASNRLQAVFAATDRRYLYAVRPGDEHLGVDGRVLEVLSEHLCQGWLEGYLLTGRHGVFNCYEAFAHIVDSMVNQHAKWLKVSNDIGWREPIASLNYLLSSHVWRQDHNGFSHQDPGFIDHVVNKKAEISRVYLPPDANTLLCTLDHCLRTVQYVNVIVAGKQPGPAYLDIEQAIEHCSRGLSIWSWASNEQSDPDVVLAGCGDVPTMEVLAAAALLRELLPQLRVRVINVVDLMRLQDPTQHPHGLPDDQFDELFTIDRPIIFAYHGYPSLIHRLAYRRRNHGGLHVRGYQEEGTTTTPFDMVMRNGIDRFQLAMDAIDRGAAPYPSAGSIRARLVAHRVAARAYTRAYGQDAPQIRDWVWPG